jgi:hypothetical protein
MKEKLEKEIIGHILEGELDKAKQLLDSLSQEEKEEFLWAFEHMVKVLAYGQIKGLAPLVSEQGMERCISFLKMFREGDKT